MTHSRDHGAAAARGGPLLYSAPAPGGGVPRRRRALERPVSRGRSRPPCRQPARGAPARGGAGPAGPGPPDKDISLPARHRGGTQTGFTLLELLVAVSIFALVSLMAFGGLRSVMDTEAAVRAEGTRLRGLQQAMHLMARDLEQAVPRGIRDTLGDPVPALRGGAGGLALELTRGGGGDFITGPHGGLRRVAYRVVGGRLERLRWPVLDRTPGMKPAVDVVLEDVEDHQVRFLADGAWSAFWPARQQDADPGLPAAIEVSLTLPEWGPVRRLYRVGG